MPGTQYQRVCSVHVASSTLTTAVTLNVHHYYCTTTQIDIYICTSIVVMPPIHGTACILRRRCME